MTRIDDVTSAWAVLSLMGPKSRELLQALVREDIGPDYTPLDAGLGWKLDLASGKDFIGRDAILEQRERALTKLLAGFTLAERDIVLLGRETIYRDGKRVGWLSSDGWGYTLQSNVGLGYVRNPDGVARDYLESCTYALEVAGERYPCELQLQPLYDPKMQKMKV